MITVEWLIQMAGFILIGYLIADWHWSSKYVSHLKDDRELLLKLKGEIEGEENSP